jgi:hypothetical protein
MKTLHRQIIHWLHAAERLADINSMASETAWQGLESSTQVLIKNYLQKNISLLVAKGRHLEKQLNEANNNTALHAQLRKALLRYKAEYIRIETTIHFYTDAINTRTQKDIAAMLQGCDALCKLCLEAFLKPLHKPIPTVITYLDKGLGAAIMKAGLRLWDGSVSPAALIKITYHNLLRPTAVLHECGHQVAHLLGWNKELAETLFAELKEKDAVVAKAFSNWSSEIAADAVALCTTGFAAVAALHDVVDGEGEAVFIYDENDPHPISYLRVLLNCAMCDLLFGNGPWQQMAAQWKVNHPLKDAGKEANEIIVKSVPHLQTIAKLILQTGQKAFAGKAIASLIDTAKANPVQLGKIEDQMRNDPVIKPAQLGLQYVALSGYKIGTGLGNIKAELEKMHQFLIEIKNTQKQYYSLN